MDKKTIKVVAGIILNANKNKILMSQRTDKDYIDQWEFPGGKIEADESDEIALARELNEELGIQISNTKFYMQKIHEYDTKYVDLRFYWVTAFDGRPQGRENQPIEWQPVEKIDTLNFLAANQGVMQQVKKILTQEEITL